MSVPNFSLIRLFQEVQLLRLRVGIQPYLFVKITSIRVFNKDPQLISLFKYHTFISMLHIRILL